MKNKYYRVKTGYGVMENMMILQKKRIQVIRRVFAVLIASLFLSCGTAFGMGLDLGGGDADPDSASDNVMSTCVRLSPSLYSLSSPTAVAVDLDGRQYVADPYLNRVVVLSQSGRFLTNLEGLAKPISVAVDTTGRIYVGNAGRGNVEVYDADFTFLHKLGFVDGEFGQPNDIAVDSSGHVYVADKKTSVVRRYDADGNSAGLLGGPGTGDGEFHHPLSIAIDQAAQEMIVLDQASKARVQFFDMGGTFIRSFTRYGDTIGDMVRPQHVAVDKESRLYITDSLQNVVLVYDNLGIYLGVVNDLDNPLRTPLGLTIGASGRMYVASRLTGSIEVFGIDDYTSMHVNPAGLVFKAKVGGESPTQQTITILNSGAAIFNWHAYANNNWINLSETTGVLASGQAASFDIGVDITGLKPGGYEGSVTVATGQGATEVVRVVMTVLPAAKLSVGPRSLSFFSETGVTPNPQTITISNVGSAPLNWHAAPDQDWISLSNSSGTIDRMGTGADVTVLADISSLAAGIYAGAITITGYEAVDSPIVVGVTLTLTEPAGSPGGGDPPTPENREFDEMTWTLGDKFPSAALNDVWTDSGSQVFAVGQDGIILHYSGTEWRIMDSPTDKDLFGVWGSADPEGNGVDVFAVGSGGTILHFDGSDWNVMASLGVDLQGVWGTSAIDVYAVGQGGVLLHYNGTNWTAMASPTDRDLFGIWGIFDVDANDIEICAVGKIGTITCYDGSRWRMIKSSTKKDLYGVWGSSRTEIFAVGQDGTVLKSAANRWNVVNSPTIRDLKGIWGASASDIHAVGSAGTILHYDGAGWRAMNAPTAKDLNSVWGSWQTGVFAAGQDLTLLYFDGGNWQSLVSALEGLNSVWGRSASDVYAVGMLGTILHYDGYAWGAMDSPTTNVLNSVWGGRATDVFAVGTEGVILRYNGQDWSAMVSPTTRPLYGVWGAAQTELYAVGQHGTFLNFNGTGWESIKNKVKQDLYGIWGRSATDVYVVGQAGTILHYNGIALRSMASPTTSDLYSVRGCSETDVFAVGQGGTFMHYDGSGWSFLESATSSNLYGLWCSSETDVFVVGQNDTFLYFDGNKMQPVDFGTDSSLRSVWGSTETTDIFAVGSDGGIIHGRNE
jgi:hypothetical protein